VRDQSDSFSQGVKDILAHRAGHRCSCPSCRALTIGPASGSLDRFVNIGVAAHITAASPKGPRYDPKKTSEQRRSVGNGLWLCQNHAKEVDSDSSHFTEDVLLGWKNDAEVSARALLGRPLTSHAIDVDLEVVFHRTSEDGLIVVGNTNLPDGTKLMIDLQHSHSKAILGQAHAAVLNGTFAAGPFTDKGRPHPHDWYIVKVYSFFNGPWQQPAAVISIVGDGGNNLAGRYAEPVDSDVEDPEFMLQASFECVGPPCQDSPSPTPESIARAISIVQNSILTVDGRISAGSIQKVVEYFMSVPELRVCNGWSGEVQANGLIRVTYSYWNGAEPAAAIWDILVDSGEVHYRNRYGKWMSWMPSE
jgi:hypothetical protein